MLAGHNHWEKKTTSEEHYKFLIYCISIVAMKTKVTKMCTNNAFEMQLNSYLSFTKVRNLCHLATVMHDLQLSNNERWTRATILWVV